MPHPGPLAASASRPVTRSRSTGNRTRQPARSIPRVSRSDSRHSITGSCTVSRASWDSPGRTIPCRSSGTIRGARTVPADAPSAWRFPTSPPGTTASSLPSSPATPGAARRATSPSRLRRRHDRRSDHSLAVAEANAAACSWSLAQLRMVAKERERFGIGERIDVGGVAPVDDIADSDFTDLAAYGARNVGDLHDQTGHVVRAGMFAYALADTLPQRVA